MLYYMLLYNSIYIYIRNNKIEFSNSVENEMNFCSIFLCLFDLCLIFKLFLSRLEI